MDQYQLVINVSTSLLMSYSFESVVLEHGNVLNMRASGP